MRHRIFERGDSTKGAYLGHLRISYYKRGAAWVCQSLQFDTNVDDLIRKAADSNIRMDTK